MQKQEISLRVKMSYGAGAFGKDLVYGLVATFIMFYFTDIVGIAPLFLGGLFFVARLWDAINDPIMGMIVDNTRTRWGKFRPWILSGTLINSIVLLLLFYNPSFSSLVKYIYISIVYLLWGMTYTIMDIPYWSMIPALSSNQSEREKLAVIPRVFASLGFFTVASAGLIFVEKAGKTNIFGFLNHLSIQEKGFFLLSASISIIFIGTILITFFNVKEEAVSKNNTSLKDLFRVLFRNDQALVVMVTMIIFNSVTYITTGLGLYFFKYNMSNELLFSHFTIVAGISQVLAMVLFPVFTKRISRRKIFQLSVLLPILGYVLLFLSSLFGKQSISILLGCGVILFFGLGLSQVLSTVLLADSVDYGEWKLRQRNEGVIFSMQPFVVKFASATSALVIGAGLTIFKFKANEIQSEFTLNGIRMMMFLLPILGLVLSLYIYNKYYKIDKKFYNTIIDEIGKREESPVYDSL
ncbi:melibiose:sodium transporter MelB [Oceanispirochaeta crateris]|nr:melibiose:sodium transporter MelB [Oceanispirochaeta crateris]